MTSSKIERSSYTFSFIYLFIKFHFCHLSFFLHFFLHFIFYFKLISSHFFMTTWRCQDFIVRRIKDQILRRTLKLSADSSSLRYLMSILISISTLIRIQISISINRIWISSSQISYSRHFSCASLHLEYTLHFSIFYMIKNHLTKKII
jgi:hypothetical protein